MGCNFLKFPLRYRIWTMPRFWNWYITENWKHETWNRLSRFCPERSAFADRSSLTDWRIPLSSSAYPTATTTIDLLLDSAVKRQVFSNSSSSNTNQFKLEYAFSLFLASLRCAYCVNSVWNKIDWVDVDFSTFLHSNWFFIVIFC